MSAAVLATLATTSVACATGWGSGDGASAAPTAALVDGGGSTTYWTTPAYTRPAGSPAGDTSGPASPTSPTGQIDDQTPPNVALKLPASKQLHDRAAYRNLIGTVADPFSGVANVEIAVYRATPHATALSFTGTTFHTVSLATAKTAFVKVFVADSAWSLGVPGLTHGKYVVLLRATDLAGNVSPLSTTKLSLR